MGPATDKGRRLSARCLIPVFVGYPKNPHTIPVDQTRSPERELDRKKKTETNAAERHKYTNRNNKIEGKNKE